MVLPLCKFGYPEYQLKDILGEEKFKKFMSWMVGQTFSSCDGRIYDYKKKEYVESGCGPHGYVYYSHDVARFLKRKPVID